MLRVMATYLGLVQELNRCMLRTGLAGESFYPTGQFDHSRPVQTTQLSVSLDPSAIVHKVANVRFHRTVCGHYDPSRANQLR